MSVVVSCKSHITVLVPFKVEGIYDNGQWALKAKWKAKDGGTLSANALLQYLTDDVLSLPKKTIIPEVDFSSAYAEIVPQKSYVFGGKSSISWSEPFSIPAGLKIENLGFSFAYQTPTHNKALTQAGNSSSVIVQAQGDIKVSIDEHKTSFGVACYFSKTTPQFILVDKIPTLSLSDVLSHFNLTSISNIIDVKFANSQIYYLSSGANKADLPSLPFTPQSGLNFQSDLTVTLLENPLPSITVDVNVNQSTGGGKTKGINFTGSFDEPISLIDNLLVLTENSTKGHDASSKGPTINFDTQTSPMSIGFDCGFEVLGNNFGNAGMTISNENGNRKFSGNLSYTGPIGPYTGSDNQLSLSMSYTKAKGITIDNWSAFGFNDNSVLPLSTIATQMSTLNQAACPAAKALGLVLKRAIITDFTVVPKFVTVPPAGSDLPTGKPFYISVTGTYSISTPNIAYPPPGDKDIAASKTKNVVVCQVNLPELTVAIDVPSSFTFDKIVSTITSLFKDNVGALIQQLWNDPPALAKFLAVFAGTKALKKIINKVCDKKIDKGNGEEEPSRQKQLEDYTNELGDAGDLSALPSGILGAAGGGIFWVASHLGVSCHSSGGGHHNGGGGNGHQGPLGTAPAPTILQSQFLEIGSTWSLIWKEISTASYFSLQLYDNTSTNPISFKGTASTDFIFHGIDPSKAPYKCKMMAFGDPGYNNSSTITVRLTQLAQVSNFSTSCSIEKSQISFSFDGSANAQKYTVKLINPANNQVLLTQSDVTATSGFFTVDSQITELSNYQISVVAKATRYFSSTPYLSPIEPMAFGIGNMQIGSTFIIH